MDIRWNERLNDFRKALFRLNEAIYFEKMSDIYTLLKSKVVD